MSANQDKKVQNDPRWNWARPFFTIWTGQALSLIGSQLVQFSLIWWLTRETGSAAVLTTATLAGMLPQVIIGPFVGTLVDRWNRKRIMIAADGLIATVTLVLAYLYALDQVQIWTVYLAMFFRSLGTAFHQPAMQSSTSLMVPEEHLTRVQGANQTLQGGLNIISAPLGALLLEILPISNILGIDVLSALFAITPLLFIDLPQPKTDKGEDTVDAITSIWDDFREGIGYVTDWPGLVVIILMAIVLNMIITPAFSLLPLLVKDTFNGSALELGWVESAFGVGTVLGGLTLSAWGGFSKRIVTTLAGLIASSVGFFLVALSPPTLLSMVIAGVFIIGVMITMINGPIHAILQATVAPAVQGRVFTLVRSLTSLMSPFGLIIAGPLAEFTTVQAWYFAGGCIILGFGLCGFFIPALLEIEENGSRSVAEGSVSLPS